MGSFALKRVAVVLILATILSLSIIRVHSQGNVPYCINSAGCRFDQQPHGTVTYHTFGYPLAYRQTEIFRPANNDQSKPNYAGYAEASIETQKFSLVSAVINVVFWFALLYLLSGFIRPRAKTTSRAAAPKDSGKPGEPVAKDTELR